MSKPEDDLEAYVRGADRPPDVDYQALLRDVEAQIAGAEKKPLSWLRARATWARRAIAIGAAFLIAGVVGAAWLRSDLDDRSLPHVAVAIAGLALLLSVAAFEALRPLHQPARAPWMRFAIAAATLVATCAVAALPPMVEPGTGPSWSPCLFFGLLTGLPVYLLLRILDRGSSSGPLLGACAAGLLGNLVLELHCPSHDPQHLMIGHFGVAVLFVLGLGSLHLLLRRR
jgi:hypothetical protein